MNVDLFYIHDHDCVWTLPDLYYYYFELVRLNSLVVECWLRVWEVPGSIPSQGPRHTKNVIKMVPVVPLFGTQKKGKYWLFLKNNDRTKNVMDEIWVGNPSSLAVVAGMKKQMTKQKRKSRTLIFFFNLN